MMNSALQVIRGYELREQVGEGGFGAVYRAYQPIVDREVAIKVILPEHANQPQFIRNFETEARLVARLEHPHIIPLYDFWRNPDGAFLVMRYVRGGNLREAMKERNYTLQEAVKLFDQIAAALAVAHRNGVIHRDLKPENILLDEDGNVYLTDFGIAKVLGAEPSAEEEENISGSPAYMSPEQLKGTELTPQTDIYGLGIVLYEIVTGVHPLSGLTFSELIHQHLYDPLPDLSQAIPDHLVEVNDVIQIATSKDSLDRYADTLKMATAFRVAIEENVTPAISIQADQESPINPYKGLRPFEEADAVDFFGREALVKRLLARLEHEAVYHRFLAVVGPSGSGKSSAVKAGLIPAIRRDDVPGSESWFIVEMIPGTNPLKNLEAALLSVAQHPSENLAEQLQNTPDRLAEIVNALLGDVEGDLLLVIDQFEEVFTQSDNEIERSLFLNMLCTALSAENTRLRIIVTLRADFMDRPLQYDTFSDMLRQRVEFVLPLSPEELEQAITMPARGVGLTVSPELIVAIVADVREEPGMLPLLQYALTEAFEHREGRVLTLASYQAIGGMTGALARRADEIYDGLNSEQQKASRQIFLRLVTLGEGKDDTRRRARHSELASVITDKTLLNDILDRFGRFRLLTFDRDEETREPTVEVAHEALLREWQLLREWLDESRADVRLERQLASANADWDNGGRDPSFLLRGIRLTQYEEWVKTTDLALTMDEQNFISVSIAERERLEAIERERLAHKIALERRSRNILWALAGVLLIGLVLAIGLTIVAFNQRSLAQDQATLAENNAATAVAAQEIAEINASEVRSLALSSAALDSLRNGSPDIAIAMALAANQVQNPNVQAQQALVDSLDGYFMRQRLFGHTDTVRDVRFTLDGTQAISAANDKTLILWDIESGEALRTYIGHEAAVRALDISPDGKTMVSGAKDGVVILWDIASGDVLQTMVGHEESAGAVRFSPDGSQIISGSKDTTLILWDASTGQQLQTFKGHEGPVNGVDFTPDGTKVLSGSDDATMILWDIATGEAILTFEGAENDIRAVAISPDGTMALSGDNDELVILWDMETGEEIRKLVGHTDNVRAVAFSPDGRLALSGANDTNVLLWDIQTGELLKRFRGHTGQVPGVAFNRDGTAAISGSNDKTVIIWDIASNDKKRILSGADGKIRSLAISPDGATALSDGDDDKLYLWDLATGELMRVFGGHDDNVQDIAFSPDGTTAVTASEDETIVLWDIETGDMLQSYSGNEDEPNGVAFHPDGNSFAVGLGDNSIIQWDVASGEIIQRFNGHDGDVESVVFSPDGKSLLSGSHDQSLILWDVASGEPRATFEGHTAEINTVALSPDGTMAASGSVDRTVIVWDVESQDILYTLTGHTDSVSSVTFSPDGTTILSASDDSTIILWDAMTGDKIHTFRGHDDIVNKVAFSPDGRTALSGAEDDLLILWKIPNYPDGIKAWIQNNRYIPELSCKVRETYRLEACENEDNSQ